MASIHVETLNVNKVELHAAAEQSGEPPAEAQGSSSGPAATARTAPSTPQATGGRRDGGVSGGGGAAELTWQLLAAPSPLPPSSPGAAKAPEGQGSPPYWDDSGPRQPELKPGSLEWRLHRTPSQARGWWGCCSPELAHAAPAPSSQMLHRVSLLQVDERDKGTPDEWIRRNPDMIRLTSKQE